MTREILELDLQLDGGDLDSSQLRSLVEQVVEAIRKPLGGIKIAGHCVQPATVRAYFVSSDRANYFKGKTTERSDA
jgi:hypothetical protein